MPKFFVTRQFTLSSPGQTAHRFGLEVSLPCSKPSFWVITFMQSSEQRIRVTFVMSIISPLTDAQHELPSTCFFALPQLTEFTLKSAPGTAQSVMSAESKHASPQMIRIACCFYPGVICHENPYFRFRDIDSMPFHRSEGNTLGPKSHLTSSHELALLR